MISSRNIRAREKEYLSYFLLGKQLEITQEKGQQSLSLIHEQVLIKQNLYFGEYINDGKEPSISESKREEREVC